MAKGKTGSGISYTSKGEHRNVSRKIKNSMRADHNRKPPMDDLIKKMAHRDRIINSPKGAKEKELRERYLKEDHIETIALKLYEQYREVGITWAACVQAAKTNYSEPLHMKWGPILKAFKEEQKDK